MTEIIHHNETGLIVQPGNVTQLATQLEQLIVNDALRSELGKNAFRYAQSHLTREAMVQKIEHIYKHLLTQGGH